MKKYAVRLIALFLAAVLLTGCTLPEDYRRIRDRYFGATTHFSEMEYVRPDSDDFLEIQHRCVTLAEEGTDLDALTDAIWEMYDVYDRFYTLYTLANISYSRDLTDLYWKEEYAWCQEKALDVDAGLDQLLYALAASPLKAALESEDLFGAGYFNAYQGESLWDEALTALMEQETALTSRYNAMVLELPEEDDPGYADAAMALVELYAQLIALRQKQAALAGYEDYISFAGDFYYSRDYTPAQVQAYLTQIRETLVPLYRQVCTMDDASLGYAWAGEKEVFAYLEQAAKGMGGIVAEAFDMMTAADLYDIAPGEHKYPASFEVYLWDYDSPYVFVNPEGTNYDALSFAHEFGHFCSDYAAYGSGLNTDCAEVLSQGMEYLSLCRSDETQQLTRMKMADSICVYVEQAAYTAFEYAAYSLNPETLTAENLVALYEEVTAEYGFDAVDYDGTELVGITHFFSYPCYIFSYIISNDAAMQLYQLEQTETGSGLACYEQILASDAWNLTEFLEEAGLKSPFAPERLTEVAHTFRQVFGS